MYELVQVQGDSYYIQSPAKIGLVRLGPEEVCLIDSGNDKDAGKKVRQILASNGWRLTAIYNTHSNADHIGGNKYLQAQTGCKIYAPASRLPLPVTQCWSPPFCMAVSPARNFGTSF